MKDLIYPGFSNLEPKYAAVDHASSGDNTIISAISDRKIRVLAVSIFPVGTAVNIYLKIGSTSKLGSASRPIVLDRLGATGPGGFVLGFNYAGWFQGTLNEALILNLSAAQGVVGSVTYLELP